MNYMLGDRQAVVLEEEIAQDYEPDYQEILDYAEFLGMDLQRDQEFFYIAKEGLKAPLPNPWKPIQDDTGELYFYNFQTGETIQEHPCDEYYKQLFLEEKSKKERKIHEAMIKEGKHHLPAYHLNFKFWLPSQILMKSLCKLTINL